MTTVQIPVGGELVLDAVDTGPPDGRLVVLLHGFPQTSSSWRRVWPTLVDAGCRVVAPDQRGYSPGARPDGVEAYRGPHLVADVLAVLDHLQADRADLVGHDWGAAVAWQVAGRHPDRVRTLTTLSVPHPLAFVEALRTDDDQRRRSQYMRDFGRPGYERELLKDGAAGLRSLFDGAPEVDVEHVVQRLGEPSVLRHCLDWYAAQSLEDATGLGPVTAPTLHIWSDRDRALGPAAARSTGRYVQGPYRFEVLPGVTHWVPEQAPDRVAALVLEQLRAHP